MDTSYGWLDSVGTTTNGFFLLDTIVKATLLLMLAGLMAVAMWRASAAMRHRLWCLVFVSLLLLPMLSWVLPDWRVAILPQLALADHTETLDTLLNAPLQTNPTLTPELHGQDATLSGYFGPLGSDRSWETLATQPGLSGGIEVPRALPTDPIAADEDREMASESSAETQPAGQRSGLLWIAGLLLLWLGGALLFGLPILISLFHIRTVARESRAVDPAEEQTLLFDLCRTLGLRQPVTVLETERTSVPMTWGVLHPVVMLPMSWRKWSLARRRIVLLHELAHIKRADVACQLLGRVACCLYWFHPLAWLALRRLRIERELACDDCVVMSGECPSEYARQLVDIARTYCAPPLPAAVAMAHQTTLEQRVRAMLDRARSHLPLSRSMGRALLVSAALLLAVMAVVHPSTNQSEAGQDSPADRETASQSPPVQIERATDPPKTVTVTGTVLAPDGAPLANAVVRAAAPLYAMLKPIVGDDFEPPVFESKSKADGSFSISFSSQPFGDVSQLDARWRDLWKQTKIAAFARGHGPAWVNYDDLQPGEAITLKLVEDLPIRGRVLDLEGRPVSDVTVQVGSIGAARDEDLTPWLEAAQAGEVPWTLHNHIAKSVGCQVVDIPSEKTTDSEGRFEIRGVGRERVLSLTFESAQVAHQSVQVVTRSMQPIERLISHTPRFGNNKQPIFGAAFDYTASPARAITGTVHSAETGEPLEGVGVESYKFANHPFSNHRVLKTVTNARGEFQLTGMPKGNGNRLIAVPNDDQPYFMRYVNVPDDPGLDPVHVEIEVHRGIWITGRITDEQTGEPIARARVYYMPFRSNKFAQALPEFDDNGNVEGDQMRYTTDVDGRYRLVGLPGPAVIGASSVLKRYREGYGYDKIPGPHREGSHYLDTYNNPVFPNPKFPTVMAAIEPAEDAESFELDLQMDPGLTVEVRVTRPAGKRHGELEIIGASANNGRQIVESDRFEVRNLGPNEVRRVLLHDKQQKLGRIVEVRSREGVDELFVVKLEPLATVTGRLLDSDGDAMTGTSVRCGVMPSADFALQLPTVTTDREGRFQMSLFSGSKYSLMAEGGGIEFAEILRMLTVEPNEVKQLGDLQLSGRRFQPVRQEASASSPSSTEGLARSGLTELRGRVLRPDGQPQRRGRIWVREPLASQWMTIDYSRNNGSFSVWIDRSRMNTRLAEDPQVTLQVAATAKGYGFAWAKVDPAAMDEELVLTLVEDTPIEGRIVSLDGKPVAGAQIDVLHLLPVQGSQAIDEYIQRAPSGSGVWINAGPNAIPAGPEVDTMMTDEKGSFRIEGLGAQRVVRMQVSGKHIADSRLAVVTRSLSDSSPADGMIAARPGWEESVCLAKFTLVATSGRTLRGP